MLRGKFTFRPYEDDRRRVRPQGNPYRSMVPVELDRPAPKPQGEACYFCSRVGKHEKECPKVKFCVMRAGECWVVMGEHVHVTSVDHEMRIITVLRNGYRYVYTREQIEAYAIRPYQAVGCTCEGQ